MPRGRREHSSPGALGPRMPQLSKGCGRLLAVDGQRHSSSSWTITWVIFRKPRRPFSGSAASTQIARYILAFTQAIMPPKVCHEFFGLLGYERRLTDDQ